MISVIVTFYEGNKYVSSLCSMFQRNLATLKDHGMDAELLIVNDSPWAPVMIPERYTDLPIRIHANDRNMGIHAGRVAGIENAEGEYLLLLDQDDEIADNYLLSQYEHIGDHGIVVCNGIKELDQSEKVIYKDRLKFGLINRPLIYLCAANQIVSPGQCLIRKDCIPTAWMQYPLQSNGSDDLFLWLLYLVQGHRFAKNSDSLYRHRQVGDNLSNDLEKMCESDAEMCNIALRCELLPTRWIKKRKRMCTFVAESGYTQKITLKTLMRYPDIIFIKTLAYLI